MLQKAYQNIAAGGRKFRVCQLCFGLDLHGHHGLSQGDVSGSKFRAASLGDSTPTMIAIQVANSPEPGQDPLFVFRPAPSELDEIPLSRYAVNSLTGLLARFKVR